MSLSEVFSSTHYCRDIHMCLCILQNKSYRENKKYSNKKIHPANHKLLNNIYVNIHDIMSMLHSYIIVYKI